MVSRIRVDGKLVRNTSVVENVDLVELNPALYVRAPTWDKGPGQILSARGRKAREECAVHASIDFPTTLIKQPGTPKANSIDIGYWQFEVSPQVGGCRGTGWSNRLALGRRLNSEVDV